MIASRYTFAEYSNAWPSYYQAVAAEWRDALGDEMVSIHHIGSTSVPGLAAKPIIDVLVGVKSINRIDERSAGLESQGYRSWGEYGLPGRRYFTKDVEGMRIRNVHVYPSDHPDVTRHLAFRDYLRSHASVRADYEALKRRLYALHQADIGAYSDGKDAWIKRVESEALRWFAQVNFPGTERRGR